MAENRRASWKLRPMPASLRCAGVMRCQLDVASHSWPTEGTKPLMASNKRRLAGAVRADESEDLAVV